MVFSNSELQLSASALLKTYMKWLCLMYISKVWRLGFGEICSQDGISHHSELGGGGSSQVGLLFLKPHVNGVVQYGTGQYRRVSINKWGFKVSLVQSV